MDDNINCDACTGDRGKMVGPLICTFLLCGFPKRIIILLKHMIQIMTCLELRFEPASINSPTNSNTPCCLLSYFPSTTSPDPQQFCSWSEEVVILPSSHHVYPRASRNSPPLPRLLHQRSSRPLHSALRLRAHHPRRNPPPHDHQFQHQGPGAAYARQRKAPPAQSWLDRA